MEPQPGEASPLVIRPRRVRNPPILTMVKEAVRLLHEKKGTSVVAIRRYIRHTYPSVDPIRLKYYLKRALIKGLNSGVLVRPPHSSAQGATGRFKLAAGKAKQQKVHEEEPMEGEAAPGNQKKDVKKPKVKPPEEGKTGDKGKAKPKPRAKVGDSAEEKEAPSEQPKASTSKDSTQATVKPKEKSSKEGAPAKLSAPGTSQAKATAAPKKAAAKGAKKARKGHGPDQPESKDQAETPVAKKAKVPVAVKRAKARAESSTAKAGEGPPKPEGKEETLKGKAMRKATKK